MLLDTFMNRNKIREVINNSIENIIRNPPFSLSINVENVNKSEKIYPSVCNSEQLKLSYLITSLGQ
jgi:hypothetical protein